MKIKKLKVYPENTIDKVEFNKVLEITSSFCLGEIGKNVILNSFPEAEFFIVKNQLDIANEYKLINLTETTLPLYNYVDVTDDLRFLSKEGYILSVDSIKHIYSIVNGYNGLSLFFNEERRDEFPKLSSLINEYDGCKIIIGIINNIFTSDFVVKDNASPELASIRKVLKRKYKEIDGAFSRAIKFYMGKGCLKDTIESFRNGRRVLSVKAEYKRQVKGVIHDDSATGKTVFIEPQEVLQLNYDLFDLQLEERNEIKKILLKLCNELRPFGHEVKKFLDVIAKLDALHAKVKFSAMVDGVIPKLIDKPFLNLKKAIHPLLYIKNLETGEPTIPFDLKLLNDNKILVISGPNAGGKSVTLKSVGLLQMMVQSGFLIPVDPESIFGIYDKMFTDIGDQQSIEKDLSTYSSRLINHKKILLHSTPNSLVLVDEFGSGTDPQIGGAMAEAVLDQLVTKGVYGIITTHYSNLKIYAHKTKGVVNGAMSFDRATLMPTFNLLVGKPGSSYAFEISERIGLPKKIIKYAQKNSGKNVKDVEEVLTDLRSNLASSAVQYEKVADKEKQLDQMIKVYESLFNDLELKKRRLKSAQKETELGEINKLKFELKEVLKSLDKKNISKEVNKLKEKIELRHVKIGEKLTIIKEDLKAKDPKEPLKVGDHVQLVNGGAKGDIVDIRKGKAVVEMGMMKMEIKVEDLDLISAPIKNIYKKGVSVKLTSASSLQSSKLDIRGMMPSEAIEVLEDFFDNNLLSDNRHLEIIHGKGTGVLRKLVKQKIKEYQFDANVYHPTPKAGGNGKTIVDFI